MRLWLGPGGSGWSPTSACSMTQSPKLLWASPDSRKGYEPSFSPYWPLVLSLQPQTNSTKNSAAATSPKGTLPPAALVLNPSAPTSWPSSPVSRLCGGRCQEAWGKARPVSRQTTPSLTSPSALGCGGEGRPQCQGTHFGCSGQAPADLWSAVGTIRGPVRLRPRVQAPTSILLLSGGWPGTQRGWVCRGVVQAGGGDRLPAPLLGAAGVHCLGGAGFGFSLGRMDEPGFSFRALPEIWRETETPWLSLVTA